LGRADTVTETGDAYKSDYKRWRKKHRKAVANSEPRTKVFKAPVHPHTGRHKKKMTATAHQTMPVTVPANNKKTGFTVQE
jgi:hypothetical protein